jgi:hypothetical protein
MAWTQAQIDALEDAIATGVQTVKHGDKTVTYASLDEMQRLLDRMLAQIHSRPIVGRARYRSGTRSGN